MYPAEAEAVSVIGQPVDSGTAGGAGGTHTMPHAHKLTHTHTIPGWSPTLAMKRKGAFFGEEGRSGLGRKGSVPESPTGRYGDADDDSQQWELIVEAAFIECGSMLQYANVSTAGGPCQVISCRHLPVLSFLGTVDASIVAAAQGIRVEHFQASKTGVRSWRSPRSLVLASP